jgi:Domain of unknown function (DUF397)
VGSESADEPIWYTASRCDSGACVEVGISGGFVLIRNSSDEEGSRLMVNHAEWREFLAGAKAGDFDSL